MTRGIALAPRTPHTEDISTINDDIADADADAHLHRRLPRTPALAC